MSKNNFIFISIASYRDPELVPTIESAIKNAQCPERLHFAVCYQDYVDNPDYEKLKKIENVKMVVVPPYESKGCCRARLLTQLIHEDEEYFLQIDSHMRFAENWDTGLIRMLEECPSEKPVLSTYCNGFNDYKLYLKSLSNPEVSEKPAYTQGVFSMVPFRLLDFFQGTPVDSTKPYPGAFISGHFIFARSEFFKQIPADPQLYFEGEETSLSIRAWTHGWDIFAPYRNLVFHKYVDDPEVEDDTTRPLHWDDHNPGLLDYLSKSKVKKIAFGDIQGTYGVGSERTIEEFERFSGVDFGKMTISEKTGNGRFSEEN